MHLETSSLMLQHCEYPWGQCSLLLCISIECPCPCRCAIDQQPRSLSSQQLGVLAHLAEMVVRRVERDKQILLQQHSKTALLRSLRNQQEAVLMCDTAMTSWPVVFTNKSCHEMLGLDEGTLGGRGVWDIFKMDAGAKVCHRICVMEVDL